jgi:hypothetical protein
MKPTPFVPSDAGGTCGEGSSSILPVSDYGFAAAYEFLSKQRDLHVQSVPDHIMNADDLQRR